MVARQIPPNRTKDSRMVSQSTSNSNDAFFRQIWTVRNIDMIFPRKRHQKRTMIQWMMSKNAHMQRRVFETRGKACDSAITGFAEGCIKHLCQEGKKDRCRHKIIVATRLTRMRAWYPGVDDSGWGQEYMIDKDLWEIYHLSSPSERTPTFAERRAQLERYGSKTED